MFQGASRPAAKIATYTITRVVQARWILTGPDIGEDGREYRTKAEAIYAAEFYGREYGKTVIHVVGDEPGPAPDPEYWQGGEAP